MVQLVRDTDLICGSFILETDEFQLISFNLSGIIIVGVIPPNDKLCFEVDETYSYAVSTTGWIYFLTLV